MWHNKVQHRNIIVWATNTAVTTWRRLFNTYRLRVVSVCGMLKQGWRSDKKVVPVVHVAWRVVFCAGPRRDAFRNMEVRLHFQCGFAKCLKVSPHVGGVDCVIAWVVFAFRGEGNEEERGRFRLTP